MTSGPDLFHGGKPVRSIASPTTTLVPLETAASLSLMPYPPDAMPGARDVQTPFGAMRVYEWGPQEGRKVLFIHGDATPSPIFSVIAERLVEGGCRVLLFGMS